MMYALKLSTNGDVSIIEIPEDKTWRWYSQKIGCEIVETVHPMGLESPRVLICDEEGLLKDRPMINFLASWLYETHIHGQPICVDCLIMEEYMTVDGMDLGGMSMEDAREFADYLNSHFWEAMTEVRKAMGENLKKC